jgi:hypothetical protein
MRSWIAPGAARFAPGRRSQSPSSKSSAVVVVAGCSFSWRIVGHKRGYVVLFAGRYYVVACFMEQLSWLCGCGRRPLELKGPGFCRACYYRRYHSLRFFGGLREAVLRRDRFRCRVCGKGAPLLVHHRDRHNEKRLLITLCISCHMRLHRHSGLSRWIPKVLLELWSEIHSGHRFSCNCLSPMSPQESSLRKQAKRPCEDSYYLGAKCHEGLCIARPSVQLTL